MNGTLQTKYGTAKLNKDGYYTITSAKERNNGRKLHRLIWEDFYGCKVPKGYVIHHKNEKRNDNCILNLQLLKKEDHIRLHHSGKKVSDETRKKLSETHKGLFAGDKNPNYGKPLSKETSMKISKSKNTTGYFRVSKIKKNTSQGFVWRYRVYDLGKEVSIESVDLEKLKKKVLLKGYEWREL